ncbi:unnamed protein product [Oppiella nova]|uniref:THAP-type domain-containing protein n=1 Tax=Oppiella nova TaxID=334625 RepID=A0A7R9M6R4_9ACAR|nr:unnamed protein product [Oppiella nova]CAG2170506.1 unnamed protein product [Oppiella nova]
MGKVKTCSFNGCPSSNDNKSISFFRYPNKSRQRCEQWVRASNNALIYDNFYTKGHKISDNETVCELHFHSQDITVYSSRKLLSANAVPHSGLVSGADPSLITTYPTKTFPNHRPNSFVQKTIRKYNKSLTKPKTYNKKAIATQMSHKNSSKHGLEIIEINTKYKTNDGLSVKRRKKSHNNAIEIIELEEGSSGQSYGIGSRATNVNNKGFLMAHELFGLKRYTNN